MNIKLILCIAYEYQNAYEYQTNSMQNNTKTK